MALGITIGCSSIALAADTARPVDERLKLQVFAEAPQIVTPTGLVVDANGAVYVVESHTHFPPEDYAGPKEDRIKHFIDTDDDGRADEVTDFYEGGRATMNIAIDPRGVFYVAMRSGDLHTA